ncbi:transcriptional regulator gene cpcA [Aspergillus sclerotiicarbonarius CBS 121057]|uniref:Transcriptional regulator gene cpcA n=1 Tax=Aspergillus sclerotiicarbonarius (strain CBS 121057 / IBT 28362) TaxID=1448318 RepID=A0A319EPV4_ASPSB|nr:transcriptional regulator gene cpcA [Aspergillus sclerotiicarbonarius CBS 121057]
MAPHAPAPAAFGSSEFDITRQQQQQPQSIARGLCALSRSVSPAATQGLVCSSTSQFRP